MRSWIHAIPDSEHPTTQGHLVFLRNNPAIFKIFERTLIHMCKPAQYIDPTERHMVQHYSDLLDSGKITSDEFLYHRFNLALNREHANQSEAAAQPLVQGYLRMLDDMFELRPEVLKFFYKHYRASRAIKNDDYTDAMMRVYFSERERSRG